MSGPFPSEPPPDKATVRSHSPTLVSVSHSLKRQARSRGGQRFAIKLSWSTIERRAFAPINGFVVAQRGQYETFQITLPGFTDPLGTWAGSPVVASFLGGRTVSISGFTPGATGKCGDYFKFANHTKVYILTADFTADGAGAANIAVEPAVMAILTVNEPLIAHDVPFTVAFVGDMQEFDVAPPVLMSYEFELVEVA